MNDEGLRDLFGMWLSGAPLSPDEERALIEGLESGAPIVKELLGDAEMDGVIRNLAPTSEGARDLERSVFEALAAERDGTRFLKKVEALLSDEATARTLTGKSSRRGTRLARRETFAGGGLWTAALAAAAVFAVILILTISSSEPASPTRAQRENQRRKESLERVEAASQARVERERLERELAGWEEERVRLTGEFRRAQDLKAQEELKARQAALAKTAEAFKEKLRRAQEKEREAAEAVAQAPPPLPAPEVKQEKPGTQVAVAKVAKAENAVLVTADGGKAPAREGQDVGAGQGLEVLAGGSARLEYSDGTRVEAGEETELKDLRAEGGKRVTVAKGAVRAVVSPQPKGQAMVFASRDGEATVLGTTLRIIIDLDAKKGTRLEVEEGKVRLKNLAGKTVLVESGQYAVAEAGAGLTSKPLPVNEVLVLPHPEKSRITGREWRLVKDDDSASGYVLETVGHTGPMAGSHLKQRSSCVTFSFWADADKEYQIWVRGWAMLTQDRIKQDAVILEPGKGVFTRPCPYVSSAGENGACFDGFYEYPGYGWIGGCLNAGKNNESALAVVRFARTEMQTLKLYSDEGKMRVSAIWLSATQKARPLESQRGPDLRK